ncbi:MAG: carboxypeptidase regulatory-like domain-containing protein [Acidobacteriota bacterium]
MSARVPLAAVAAGLLALSCGGQEKSPETDRTPPAAGAREAAPAAAPRAGGYRAVEVASGGSIRGRVLYQGTPPPRDPVDITKDRAVCAEHTHLSESLVVGKRGGVRYAVVSIDPVPSGKAFPAGDRPRLDQRGCWFHPHLQVVPAGAEIDILNSDGILHNIHTFPENNDPINMAQPKFRKVMTTSFAEPDLVRVSCDVHNWMSAWIVVAAHPYHGVTGEDGSFLLDDVPPGTYTLRVWHETLGTRERPVTVSPGGRVEVDLTFGG